MKELEDLLNIGNQMQLDVMIEPFKYMDFETYNYIADSLSNTFVEPLITLSSILNIEVYVDE